MIAPLPLDNLLEGKYLRSRLEEQKHEETFE